VSRSLLIAAAMLMPLSLAAQEPHATGEAASIQPLASHSLLLDIAAAGSEFIVVGERGHVLRSADGVEWTQLNVPTRSLLCAVAAVNSQLIWVAGHDGIILHSADGGRTWFVQHFAPEDEAPLFDLWFEDSRHGFAVGAYGTCLETFDGGELWSPRLLDVDEAHFFTLVKSPGGDLFLGGEFGTLLRSSDRGGTWSRLDSPYGGSFFGLFCTRDGLLLGFGLRGRVYRSTDSGESFERTDTNTTAGLFGAVEKGNGDILLVGLSGAILESADRGMSFVDASRKDRVGIAAVLETPRGELLAVGENGVFFLGSGRED